MELALLSVMLLTQTKDVVTNAEVQRSAYTAIASFASRLGTRKPERNLKLRTTGYGGYILLHAKVGKFDDYALSADGKIVLCYTNVDLEVRAIRREGFPVHPFYKSEEDVWRQAEATLVRLGIKPTDRSLIWVPHVGSKPSMTQVVKAIFSPRIGGYGSVAFGNSISVSLDPETGKLIDLVRAMGWVYDRPVIAVSKERATKIAGQIRGVVGAPYRISTHYVCPRQDSPSPVSARLRRAHRCRLVYEIAFKDVSVYIDTQTGDCLGVIWSGNARR